jgi:hypothetical protein
LSLHFNDYIFDFKNVEVVPNEDVVVFGSGNIEIMDPIFFLNIFIYSFIYFYLFLFTLANMKIIDPILYFIQLQFD